MVDQGLLGIFSHAWIANLILAAPGSQEVLPEMCSHPRHCGFQKQGHNLFPNSKAWRSDDYAIRRGNPRQL
jgi:hypothetical protein